MPEETTVPIPHDDPCPFSVPDAVELLYCDQFAEDDRMWVVAIDPIELFRLIYNPVRWVSCLSQAKGWEGKAPVLTDDFVVTAAKHHKRHAQHGLRKILVQGIDRTNALSIVVSKKTAIGLMNGFPFEPANDLDPFARFWWELASPTSEAAPKKDYEVLLMHEYPHWYGHFEIRDHDDTRETVAIKTARFLLASLYDPEGYAGMLNGLHKKIRHGRNDDGAVVDGSRLYIRRPSKNRHSTVYANCLLNDADRGKLGEPDPFVCTVTGGSYEDSSGTLMNDSEVIKRYGVENAWPPQFVFPENSHPA